MRRKIKLLTLIFIAIVQFNSCSDIIENEQANSNLKLWYDKPASQWTEALPVGNGRLGAMIFGRIAKERIQLNEESIWAGSKINSNNPKASKYLSTIQDLLIKGENRRARKLADKYLLGTPPRIRSYQTLGDLVLEFNIDSNSTKNYKRTLSLSDGIASVEYENGVTNFTREVFASAVDDIIVVNLSSKNSSSLSLAIELTRDIDAVINAESNNTLVLDGQIIDKDEPLMGPGGSHMKFSSVLKVFNTGGTLTNDHNKIIVDGASEITIFLTAATDYNVNKLNFDRSINPSLKCKKIIENAEKKTFAEIKRDHISDHNRIFNRVELNLGSHSLQYLPTDQRLKRMQNGTKDDDLMVLYFQYGRYLLMNSSRYPGVLPANLQGIWNEHYEAPWNSDFHTNINLQMNYWLANAANLDETVLPLNNFFLSLLEPGRISAKEMYNARGWMMHHVTDPFGRTGLMDGIGWGTSPLAGAWMTLSFWRHYEFTLDKEYLSEKAYPIMKEAAQFILDFLIEDENGQLVTAPSISPENAFIHPTDREKTWLSYAVTIDIQIINELFNACISAANIVGDDPEFKFELKETLSKLPPTLVGKDGTIREWIEDYEEVEPGHRHMSHLFGLHPGTTITPDTPEFFTAAQKTIEKRLSSGGGHTGWSRAWIVNFYARLLDGENAYKHLTALLQKSTLPNLFDSHPPFQIDGNFGGTAGICEMLLQSQNNEIVILPAITSEWKDGFVKGLKARGNYTIDIFWNKGELINLRIKSASADRCNIKYNDKTVHLEAKVGEEYLFNSNLESL